MGILRFKAPVDKPRNDPFNAKKEDGKKMHPDKRLHHGIDFAAQENTPVKASEEGVVERASFNNAGYGEVVVINHTPNAGRDKTHIYTLYAHLKKYEVKFGEEVEKGKVIARSANTGTEEWKFHREHGYYKDKDKKGMHLHFEVLESPKKIEWNKTGSMGIDSGVYRKKPDSYFGEDTAIEGTLADLNLDNLTDEQLKTVSACVEARPVIDYESRTCHVDWFVAGIKKGTTDQYNKEIDLKLTGEEVEMILKDPARYVAKRSAPLTYDVKV